MENVDTEKAIESIGDVKTLAHSKPSSANEGETLTDKQQQVFDFIKNDWCVSSAPNYPKTLWEHAIDLFFPVPRTSYGIYEQMFHLIYRDLEQQVVFGTGKDGYKKYGLKKITADFYDPKTKTVYEIDGPEHEQKIHSLRDQRRDLVLNIEYGIRTIRITNDEVEALLKRLIKKVVPA